MTFETELKDGNWRWVYAWANASGDILNGFSLMDLPMDKLNQLDYLKAFKLLHKVLKGQGLPRWLNWPAWLQQQLQQLQPQQEAARAASQASASTGDRKKDLYRLIPKPANFAPADRDQEVSQWRDWYWSFKQYLLVVDGKFEDDLKYVERSDID